LARTDRPLQRPARPSRPAVSAAVFAIVSLLAPPPAHASPPDLAAALRGHRVFNRYCISCHGVEGDGRGPTAAWVDPRPRALTSGVFKFRSTPSGTLPTDEDLLRTVDDGLGHTSMPRWSPLSLHERRDVVQYVKSLSPRFATEPSGTPIAIPPRPALTPALATRGQAVGVRMQCATCHGDAGRGDGPSAPTLRDDWGQPSPPRDFTTGPLKVGEAPEDLYRAFLTGLNGSAMPSYAEAGLTPDDAWALVAYVRSLRSERRRHAPSRGRKRAVRPSRRCPGEGLG